MSTSEARYHHGGLRAALVEAAMRRLDEGGTAELSLRELARDTGVSPMAAYRHFADKDALLAAVADDGFRRLDAREADAALPPRERLLAGLLGYVAFARAHPALYGLMFGMLHAEGAALPHRTASFAGLKALVCAVTGEEARDPASDVTAARVWAAVHGCASLAVAGLIGRDRLSEGFIEAILAPVAANPTGARA